jgi:hypothetical protein
MISKKAYEEFFRYHQFRRTDGKGWLGATETISTPAVTVAEKLTGADRSSTMISDVSVDSDTKVKYKLKAGTSGVDYLITIKVTSSLGNKFQDDLDLRVT